MEKENNNKLETSNILLLPKSEEDVSFIGGYREVSSKKLGYFVWLSRLCILVATISLAFFVMSTLVLFRMVPAIIVEPFLIINQDHSKGIIRNEPIDYNMVTKEQLMEAFVKQYVYIRNTVIDDRKEMQTKWFPGGMVNLLSAPGIFQEFDKYRKTIWEEMFKENLVREVEIISIKKVGDNKATSAVWNVEFRTYDLLKESRNNPTRSIQVTTRYWTTSITAYFIPERVFLGLRLLNPLGFTVFRYSQREVEGLG